MFVHAWLVKNFKAQNHWNTSKSRLPLILMINCSGSQSKQPGTAIKPISGPD